MTALIIVVLTIAVLGMYVAIERLKIRVDDLEKREEQRGTPTRPAETPARSAPLVPKPLAADQTPPAAIPLPPAAVPRPPAAVPRPPAPPLGAGTRPVFSLEVAKPTPRSEPTSPLHTSAGESLETRIGSRWLLYVGVVAIVVGVSYFVKLAIDNEWVGEGARVALSAAVGLALVVGGTRFIRGGYALYGQILAGGGVAILYVATFAASNLYALIGRPFAFVLMCAVTLLAAWLADRHRSQGLALMAVGGGFVTPFLLSTGWDPQIALFTYEGVLIAGTMYLAHRRAWPALNVTSYVLTLLTVLSWALRFYTPSQYLATELFLTLFCAMFLYILRELRRSEHPLAGLARGILATAPVLYYAASLAILAPHPSAWLIYLIALACAGVMAGERFRSPTMRFVLWLAVILPLLAWTAAQHAGGAPWMTPGLTALAAVYVIHLLQHFRTARVSDRMRAHELDVALLHGNALATYLGAYLLIDPVAPGVTAIVAGAFALWHGSVALWLWEGQRDEAVHFTALAFTLLVIAIGVQFDGAWVTVGWAAEAAAIVVLGFHADRIWLRIGGLALFAAAIGRLGGVLAQPATLGETVVLNARTASGLFIVGLTYGLAWIHQRFEAASRRELAVGVALVAAKLLLLAVVARDILGYWAGHGPAAFQPTSHLANVTLIVGSAIAWLGLTRRQEWMRAIGGAVVAAGLSALLSMQFATVPEGYTVFLNPRAFTGFLAIAVLCGLALAHRRSVDHGDALGVNVTTLVAAANLFALSLLTSEIDAYWAARGAADVWSMAREGLKAITWASAGTTLLRLGIARRHGWIRAVGALVVLAGVSRLLGLQFAAAPASYTVFANSRLTASTMVIGLLYGLAATYRRRTEPLDAEFRPVVVFVLAANVLTLTFFTSEITAYWSVRDALGTTTGEGPAGHFAREAMLSIAWAVYATGLIVVGIRKRYAPVRHLAIAIFAVTIVKVFAVDLAELDQIYRVLSIVGLGLMLLLTSYLYHRFKGRLGLEADEAP